MAPLSPTLPASPAGGVQPRLRPANPAALLGWHARFAVNPSALAALPTMTHQLTLDGVPGGLGFQRRGRVFVSTGEPLAAASDWAALATALFTLAVNLEAVPCFAPVGAEFADILGDLGMTTVRVGSAPYIHLRDWPPTGKAGAEVRQTRHRAERDGLVFRAAPARRPAWVAEVETLAGTWLEGRRAGVPFHWIFSLQPMAYAEHKQYFEARLSGQLVGLVAASPLAGRGGWYLEDVVRSPSAPASTGAALVACALTELRAQGVSIATLGGVPLSRERSWEHDEVTPLEWVAYGLRPLLTPLYSFDGLERYKSRFTPAHWENEYVALPPGLRSKAATARALVRLILQGR